MVRFAFLSLLFLLFVPKTIKAGSLDTNPDSLTTSSQNTSKINTGEWIYFENKTESLTADSISIEPKDSVDNKKIVVDKLKRRKKIIATLLAFPLPCGIIGLHRVYLGTKPYVPLVYIATLGGAAGIVPFIDFIVLLLEKDISKYENNPNIIMWAN